MNIEKEHVAYVFCGNTSLSHYFRGLIIEYFSPLFLSWDRYKSLREEVHDTSNSKKALAIIQEANCINQSALIQYAYLAAEKHKLLKTAYKNSSLESQHADENEIDAKAKDLVYFLNKEFRDIVFKNFEVLHSYFRDRSEIKPRLSLKGNLKIDSSDMIITMFSDSNEAHSSSSYDIEKNTGFASIAKTGKYFLCNNLPEAALNGEYINPRLNSKKISDLSRGSGGMKRLLLNWKDCWNDSGSGGQSSYYKSTLIVPMTLWNNDLSEEFRCKIDVSNIGRTIFGFLCIDHVDQHYFLEDDIRVGYIFADLLSNYLFQRYVYTDFSETFREVLEKTVDSDEFIVDDSTLRPIRLENIRDSSRYDSSMELEETNENNLFLLDEGLVKYIRKAGRVRSRDENAKGTSFNSDNFQEMK